MSGEPARQRPPATPGRPPAEPELTLRQLAALARAASSVADSGSLSLTLEVLADTVRQAAGLAAAQVVTVREDGHLRIVGMAGFTAAMDDFTARLADCRRLGADLVMLRVLETRHPVLVPGRRAAVIADPSWAPIHELLASADWDSFACAPLIVRERPVGVLTAYYPPGADPAPTDLDFLAAMADQAAMAVDHAALLSASREEARRRERERLARDLHDSVVQHVFSLRLHARALSRRYAGEAPPEVGQVTRAAEEMVTLATAALADLRELIFELRPADLTEHGLVEAVRAYARAVQARTGLVVRVAGPPEPPELAPDLAEDLYRIVQEAVHNVVKHAGASTAQVSVAADPAADWIVVEIRDDGRGCVSRPRNRRHFGLTSMVERAERWGGTTEVSHPPGCGTLVRARVPYDLRSAAPSPAEVP